MKKIILASVSYRRKELLTHLIGNNFEVQSSSYEEDNTLNLPPKELVMLHALGKGRDVASKLSEGVVISGIVVIDIENKREFQDFEITKVKFKNLTEQEIDDYVETGDPLDKGGGFGIQGQAAVFNVFFEAKYLSGDIKISEEHTGFQWVKLTKDNLEQYFNLAILEGAKMYLENADKNKS